MKHLILVLGGLLSAMNSYAATYTVTQITDDNYNNEYARMNDKGDVLWAAQVNSTDPGWTLTRSAKPASTAANTPTVNRICSTSTGRRTR